MPKTLCFATIAIALLALAAPANAKGCIKGAAVGGVAGHLAGHHGVLGAAAGCAIGRHEANKQKNVQPTTMGNVPPSSRSRYKIPMSAAATARLRPLVDPGLAQSSSL